MKVKRNFICGILLIIATIMTSVCAVRGKNRLSNAKTYLMSIFTMSPNTVKNWKSSSFARNFNKAIGFAPIVKEDKIEGLLTLIAKEPDLIKIGAFRKLNKLDSSATTVDSKKILILAKIQGTIELIKYYGVAYNCPKVKFTFAQGLYYVYVCKKLHGENSGDCLRKKVQLIAAFMFSHKVEVNRFVRFFLNRTKKQAENLIPGDRTIKFIDTKIACEIKFAQDNKNGLLRAAMQLYMGTSRKDKNFNCVTELKQFEGELANIDSFAAEFHYLVAKAYGSQNNFASAMEHLIKVREEDVVDSKTREINRKAQLYYEKMYTRFNGSTK
ncbi:uncharacterized protein LOC111043020 [Myzus persicae]|uniref:uncharacterized protein LOC111043020 n=1 Tax=Myzus persicae TaxID=13164 RepID=UPI000B93A064|nr:uncharacterized protein LOC111043020 [Myzus persicae]